MTTVKIEGCARISRKEDARSEPVRDVTFEVTDGETIHTDGSASITIKDESETSMTMLDIGEDDDRSRDDMKRSDREEIVRLLTELLEETGRLDEESRDE